MWFVVSVGGESWIKDNVSSLFFYLFAQIKTYFQIHYVVQQKSYKNMHTQEADSMSVWFQNKSSRTTAYSLSEEQKRKQTKGTFN